MKIIKIKNYEEKFPLDKIEIAKENVRKTNQKEGLPELETSIKNFGLIHPVILVPIKNGKYKLIVGQRRYYAFKKLEKTSIPAMIIEPMKEISEQIVSFSENIHRRSLPYGDTIEVCKALFGEYQGNKIERIRKVAKSLAISPSIVSTYLAYEIIPKNLKKMVEQNKISRQKAYKLTSAFWPDEKKILQIANHMSEMTSPEWDRALTIGKKDSKMSATDILKEAKKPQETYRYEIILDKKATKILKGIAEKLHMSVEDVIRKSVDKLVEGESSI